MNKLRGTEWTRRDVLRTLGASGITLMTGSLLDGWLGSLGAQDLAGVRGKTIGYTQSFSTIEWTVAQREQVEEGCRFAGREVVRGGMGGRLRVMDEPQMRQFARETLQRLRISIASVEQKVRFLSGGQRQSVAIDRAIAFGSKLVIMNEPTAALGAVESEKVLDLIQEMRTRGLAVIVISHNLPHVFRVADRIGVLYHGELAGVLSKGEADPQLIVDMMMGRNRNGMQPGT